MDFQIIDTWCNLFTPESMRANYHETEELAEIVRWWHMDNRLRGWSPAEFAAEVLDPLGVGTVLIPAWQMRSWERQAMMWDMAVEEVAEVCSADPKRYKGMVGINPHHRMEGVRRVERAVRDYGFVAAHLHQYGYNLAPDAPEFWPFYAKCVELGVPVMIQMGHAAERMPSEVGRPIHLDRVALWFPELKIIAAHTGWPWVEEMIAMAWKHKNVYVSTTAHLPKYWDPALVRFIDSRGIGKVLYGTDFPVVTHKESLALIEQLNLKPAALKALLHDTAATLFGL